MKPLTVVYVEADGVPVPSWVKQDLQQAGVDLRIHPCTSGEELLGAAADADVVWLYGNPVITAERLKKLTRCGVILRTGSGFDNVPVEAATRQGVIVAHTPTAVFDEVADHAIGLLFAVIRQIVPHDRALREGVWDRREHIHRWHLRGNTLGLIGFGRIARGVARKMQGFKLRILACDPLLEPEVIRAEGVRPVEMQSLLSQSDFVSLHTPLSSGTRHLIGEAQLRSMKPESVLINTCRGTGRRRAGPDPGVAGRLDRGGGPGRLRTGTPGSQQSSAGNGERGPYPSRGRLFRHQQGLLLAPVGGYPDSTGGGALARCLRQSRRHTQVESAALAARARSSAAVRSRLPLGWIETVGEGA